MISRGICSRSNASNRFSSIDRDTNSGHIILSIFRYSRSASAVVAETVATSCVIVVMFGYITTWSRAVMRCWLWKRFCCLLLPLAAPHIIFTFDDDGRVCEHFTVTTCWLLYVCIRIQSSTTSSEWINAGTTQMNLVANYCLNLNRTRRSSKISSNFVVGPISSLQGLGYFCS